MGDQIPFPLPPEKAAAAPARLTALEKAEFLRNVDIFSQLNVEELFRLASIAQEVQFPAGEIIFREDDIVDALFVVVRGKVELVSKEYGFQSLAGPREAFGIYSMLAREPNYLAAQALEDTWALSIAAEDFYNLLSHNMEIVVSIFKHFARKLRLSPRF